MEMMHQVQRGGLWEYEDRERFNQMTEVGSPYPSAWRETGVRRGGSLRLASFQTTSKLPDAAVAVTRRPVPEDGSFVFLDGERVPERVREVLKSMLSPIAAARPTADELCKLW